MTRDLPPLVVDMNKITIEDIAQGRYIVNSDLDPASQSLYNTVSGDGIQLRADDFPDFIDAIQYSIDTPNCWCHERLKNKSSEFGAKNTNMTYLRITLGENQGNSPGAPFVLEIWPSGHFSPIHNHGFASAVIKVLHGSINVKLFHDLEDSDYYMNMTISAGNVTFLSPMYYQTHQLHNFDEKSFTATLQCYRYPPEDHQHYEYFDYLDDNNSIQHFDPDSDALYLDFKEIIREEWENRIAD